MEFLDAYAMISQVLIQHGFDVKSDIDFIKKYKLYVKG